MAFEARVLQDSVSPLGDRLTTMEATYPRFIHAEIMTPRVFSRNTASSRAIPIEKMIRSALESPAIPLYWGKNRSGMQADEELSPEAQAAARELWLVQRDYAALGAAAFIGGSERLAADDLKSRVIELGEQYGYNLDARSLATPLHKQLVNRTLEPYLWHTALISSTEWENFYALRTHSDAQPEIRTIASLMRDAYSSSQPNEVAYGEYHLPLLQDDELSLPMDLKIKVAIGRCARISYLSHEGKRDLDKDIELYERLISGGHMSPLEHVATPLLPEEASASNFRGWKQHRKEIPNEDNFARVLADREEEFIPEDLL